MILLDKTQLNQLTMEANNKHIKTYLLTAVFGVLVQLVGVAVNKALYPNFSSSQFSVWYLFFPLLIPFILVISLKTYNRVMILFLVLFMLMNISGLWGIKDGINVYYNEYAFEILNIVGNLFFCSNEIIVQELPKLLDTTFPNNIYNFITLFTVNVILFFVFKIYKLVFDRLSTTLK